MSAPRPSRDAALVAVTLLAAAGAWNWATALPSGPARALIALPLAFLLPGGAIAVVLPGRARDPVAGLAVVPLISIGFYVFAALTFAAAHVELTRTSVVLAVDALVGCCALLILIRGTAPGSPFVSIAPFRLAAAAPFVALAAATFAVASIAAARVFPAERVRPSTSLAFAGRWAHAAPARSLPRRRLAVGITLDNREGRTVAYRISASLAHVRWPRQAVVLREGEAWSGLVAGPVRARPCRQRLVVVARREGLRRAPLSLTLEFASRAKSCLRRGRG